MIRWFTSWRIRLFTHRKCERKRVFDSMRYGAILVRSNRVFSVWIWCCLRWKCTKRRQMSVCSALHRIGRMKWKKNMEKCAKGSEWLPNETNCFYHRIVFVVDVVFVLNTTDWIYRQHCCPLQDLSRFSIYSFSLACNETIIKNERRTGMERIKTHFIHARSS